MSDYSAFLRSVTPTVLGLSSSTTKVKRRQYWQLAKAQSAERWLSASYAVTNVQSDYFDVEATFELAIHDQKHSGSDEAVVRIACVFEGHFHADAPVARAHAEQFATKDSWLVFWPYFRQFVSDMTGRMSVRTELLPLHLRSGTYTKSDQPSEMGDAASARKLAAPKKKKAVRLRKARPH
jgi:hypothetical protein